MESSEILSRSKRWSKIKIRESERGKKRPRHLEAKQQEMRQLQAKELMEVQGHRVGHLEPLRMEQMEMELVLEPRLQSGGEG